jgi:predicted MFS family arabinose efflux permease
VCLGLGLAAAVAVGLGRFAYALVLPAMQAALGWSYSEAGSLNAANSAGYLVGALLAVHVGQWLGMRRAFAYGTFCAAIALLLTAFSSELGVLLVLRFVPGMFGAVAFVIGGLFAAQIAASMGVRGSTGIALFYTGPGIGMLAAGLTVPFLLEWSGDWRYAWLGLGCAACVAAVLAVAATRYIVTKTSAPDPRAASGVTLTPALLSYFLFAAGYIGYMTFIMATVREQGSTPGEAAMWWLLMACAAIGSFWVWGALLAAANGRALAALNSMCALGALLPLFDTRPLVLAVSFVLFAGSFMVVVAATTNMVRLARVPGQWARWIGFFTISFGLGQIVGPLLGGVAADVVGRADAVLWMSGGLLAGAAICAWWQPSTLQPRVSADSL